jgi:hypothetical protein
MAVDVGKNIPAVYPQYRQTEGLYSGDYVDVVAVGAQLLALNNNFGSDPSLDVFDGSLGPVSSLGFQLIGGASPITKVHQLKVARRVHIDRNQNGVVDAGEMGDLAFVAGSNGVTIIDISDLDHMAALGVVPMPGIARELSVTRNGKTLLAAGDAGGAATGGDAFYIVDVANPFITGSVDRDLDGRDDRLVFNAAYPLGVGGVRVDNTRDVAYVASSTAVDVWSLGGRCSAIGINTPGPVNLSRYQPTIINSDGGPFPGTYSWTTSNAAIAVIEGSNTSSAVAVKGVSTGTAVLKVRFTCDAVDRNGIHPFEEATVTVKVQPYDLQVTEVSFTGDLDIYKDQIGSDPLIADPVWKATNTTDQNDAVGYAGGSIMKATVRFAITPVLAAPVTNVTIEGQIPGFGRFIKTGVTIPAGAEVVVSDIVADTALPARTKFHDPITINWRHMADGDSCPKCTADGTTAHKLYVTLATPTDYVYLTTLHLAVSNDGATTQADAIAKSWSFFGSGTAPNDVKTWDGRPLIYYPPGVSFLGCAINAEKLLTTPDGGGRCGSFAQLMQNVLAVNGIASTIATVVATEDTGFLVKNWTFSTTPTYAGDPQYRWNFQANPTPGNFNDMVPVPPGGVYADMTSEVGVPGQNAATPSQKAHVNHAIVRAAGVYYDPSYGLTYASRSDFETKAIDGYIKRIPSDPPGAWRVRKSNGLNKIEFMCPDPPNTGLTACTP